MHFLTTNFLLSFDTILNLGTYQSRHEIRRVKKFSSCTKNSVFFSTASFKKDTIFDAARNFSCPSYIATALCIYFLWKVYISVGGAIYLFFKFGFRSENMILMTLFLFYWRFFFLITKLSDGKPLQNFIWKVEGLVF